MRRLFLVLAFTVGCAKTETAKMDTAAMAAPAAPAMVTEADVAGSWAGTSMPMNSDSVLFHWTQDCGAGTCKGNIVGTKDTVVSTYTLSGDSTSGVSSAYMDPAVKGRKVVNHWTVHLKDGKAMGTGHFTLADKPDSTVMSYRFEGSRKQ